MLQRDCPCGGSPDRPAYDTCCGRFHRGAERPATAVELMRSRYSAFAVGDGDWLFTTWHPRTRPDEVRPDPATSWTGLEILGLDDGGVDDETGEVEFVALWRDPDGQEGRLHERSRFARRAGRWFYVDGDVD
ncbi:YchJ family protein [Nocardioides malaquae]|nr:YchJ family metal-binding protein [Nocardioides malaquae]